MYKRGRLSNYLRQRKGQVTLFIIIAILIIGVAVLFFFLIPDIRIGVDEFDEKNPQGFMQTCLENKLIETVETISLQGGSMEPEHYFTFDNVNIQYLCYTAESWTPCVIQQPLLKQHIEDEIKGEIIEDVENCFGSLVDSYEKRNYNVQLDTGITKVELLPKRIIVNMNYILTASKADTQRFEEFNIILNNNLYELMSIANSMMEIESIVGEANPRIYMSYYPDLKVNKDLMDDGTNIYTITDRNTEDKFQFASRSLVFPPGH